MNRSLPLVLAALVLAGCGDLHYVSPQLTSEEDPDAVRMLFPFYTHAGYHRIEHLQLEKINDIDIRGYAGALVPSGTYRLTYNCQVEAEGQPVVEALDRVKTLMLKPGHSYLLRTVAVAGDQGPSHCHLSVRHCEPGQRIEKVSSRNLRDHWTCRGDS
ncbi:hypothetical protein [Motiliproteus sp. SC1-56]|uniref:hypothetical protein n=1 Tax=Motiliproteus sp. SC1-56 TaxID=2799565 RepID=UPI001A8DFE9B|nr:hypothetical protein [Motiliproteus sp. SC1-56]